MPTKKEMNAGESHYQAGPKETEIIDNKIQEKSIVEPIPIYRLADLEDVVITSPANGHVLKYNSTSGKWENGAP